MKLKRFGSTKKDLRKAVQKQQHIICEAFPQQHPPLIHLFSSVSSGRKNKNHRSEVLIFIVVKDVTRPILRIFIKKFLVKSLSVESGHSHFAEARLAQQKLGKQKSFGTMECTYIDHEKNTSAKEPTSLCVEA